MFNPFIIVLVVLLIIVIGLAAYFMTRPKGIAVETQQETRSLPSNTSSDVAQTKGSDVAQTKASDAAQTNASDVAQTKASDAVQTNASDAVQTNASDVAQTNASDVAQTLEPKPIPTQVSKYKLPYNVVGSILINTDLTLSVGGDNGNVKIFDENGNVVSLLDPNFSMPNQKGIKGISPRYNGAGKMYLKIDFNQPINLSKIVITKPVSGNINEVITFPDTRAIFNPNIFIPLQVIINKTQDKYTIIYTTDKPPVLSTESFSFTNLPQYLRHLQNKNYLLY
jgi:hypothetical protein